MRLPLLNFGHDLSSRVGQVNRDRLLAAVRLPLDLDRDELVSANPVDGSVALVDRVHGRKGLVEQRRDKLVVGNLVDLPGLVLLRVLDALLDLLGDDLVDRLVIDVILDLLDYLLRLQPRCK